jgi:heptaprenyl diphosphate synthase
LLTAIALVLFLVELNLPRPLPWMRLGLGNVAVLVALLLFGAGPALAVSLVKVLLGGLLSGGLAGPAFIIGSSAALASLLAMVLLARCAPRLLSPVGLSVAGALAHQCTQLTVATMYLGHVGLLSLLPMFLVGGVVSGLLTGLAAYFALQRLVVADGETG